MVYCFQKLQNSPIACPHIVAYPKENFPIFLTKGIISEKLESIIRSRLNWHDFIHIAHYDIFVGYYGEGRGLKKEKRKREKEKKRERKRNHPTYFTPLSLLKMKIFSE